MDKAKRGKLLRERLKSKGGMCASIQAPGLHRAKNPISRPLRVRWVALPKPTGKGFVSLGPALNGRPSQWVTAPDAKQKRLVSPKNRKGIPAITVIAATLAPKKLVRTYRTVEEMLAARARR